MTPVPSNAELMRAIEGIERTQAELARGLGNVQSDVRLTAEKITTIEKSVNPDGRESIQTRMFGVERDVSDIKAQLSIAKDRRWQMWLALISSVALPLVLHFMGAK